MPDIWYFLALQLVAVLSGAATAAVILLIGGMGGVSALARRMNLLSQKVDDTDERITKEVKRRAADLGVEARAAGRGSAVKQAEEHLANNPPAPPKALRPTVAR